MLLAFASGYFVASLDLLDFYGFIKNASELKIVNLVGEAIDDLLTRDNKMLLDERELKAVVRFSALIAGDE